jgi:hypothetical protein
MTIALTNDVSARRKSLLRFAPPPAPDTLATDWNPIADIRAFQMGTPGASEAYGLLQVRTQSGLVGYVESNSLSASDLKATSQAVVGPMEFVWHQDGSVAAL